MFNQFRIVKNVMQSKWILFAIEFTNKNAKWSVKQQAGRYENPEEHPFFPVNLPGSLLPPQKYPQVS